MLFHYFYFKAKKKLDIAKNKELVTCMSYKDLCNSFRNLKIVSCNISRLIILLFLRKLKLKRCIIKKYN